MVPYLGLLCGWKASPQQWCSQVEVGEWSSMLLNPSCHHDHLGHEPLGWKEAWLEKRLTSIHKMGHPLLLKTVSCWDHPLVNIHMRHKPLSYPFREVWLFLLPSKYTPKSTALLWPAGFVEVSTLVWTNVFNKISTPVWQQLGVATL